MPTIYEANGYKNRAEYLETLADDYCVPLQVVRMIANSLGDNEDFDGLVNMVGDYAMEVL